MSKIILRKFCSNNNHLKLETIYQHKNYSWFFCKNCHLLFCSNKNKKNRFFKNRLDIFNSFKDSNKYEFLSIIKKVQQILNYKKKISWLDFGCGTGNDLLQIKGIYNAIGYEPNKYLYKKCKTRKLNVINNLVKIKSKKFDVIFSRNTFKYIDNFPNAISLVSKKIKKNGLLVWRDKYFDYFPCKFDEQIESMVTGSNLNKKAINYYLSLNKLEIILSKFYFDNSFFIIARKKAKPIKYDYERLSNFSINYYLIKHQSLLNIIYFTRLIIQKAIFLIKNIYRASRR